jgi:hypothetical protein
LTVKIFLVLIALGYFAGYPFQSFVGLAFHLHQTTISRVISRVSAALNEPQIFTKFVRMPALQEVRQSQLKLYGIAKMSGNL